MDSISLLVDTFQPIASKRLLDIGCGSGALARALSRHGAEVTGIDVSEAAVAAARQAVPSARFETGAAERLPFGHGTFDGAVFLNSLHHVPASAMTDALAEAARVTCEGGFVVVIEPLASGSFFEAFRLIEDETEVRERAQAAIQAPSIMTVLDPTASDTFVRSEKFADMDAFLARVVAAVPERRAVVDRIRPQIEAAFRRHAERHSDGLYRLDQPLKANVFRVKGRS